MSDTPQYPKRGIPYFHESLNMPPSKAAKMLVGVARSHRGPKARAKRTKPAPVKAMMPPRHSGGAKVFGGMKK